MFDENLDGIVKAMAENYESPEIFFTDPDRPAPRHVPALFRRRDAHGREP